MGLAEINIQTRKNKPLNQDLSNIEKVYFTNGDFIVGEHNSKVIAMGAFKHINNQTAEVRGMRVHTNFQGQGFGQKILQELEKRARKMGYKRVVLDTGQNNIKSNNFYKKNGYVEIGRKLLHKDYPATLYEKVLRESI